jgi:hypothetical protein
MMNRLTSSCPRREAARSGAPGTLMTAARRGNGQLAAVSSQHHVRLAARLASQDATGTLALAGGRILRFTIAVAPGGDQPAGIFAGTARWHGRTYQAGWIILPDHQQRGAAYYPNGPIRGQVNAASLG